MDKKEIGKSAMKSIFGAIPFVGALLDELFFEFNGRIKQNRLNSFVEILTEGFTEDSNINLDNIKTEEFNDLFEAVLRRVVRTKTKSKLVQYKDILIKSLINPAKETDLNELYLDLISSLSEEELIILSHHKWFDLEYDNQRRELKELNQKMLEIKVKMKHETFIVNKSKYQDEFDSLASKINSLANTHGKLEKYRSFEFYGISEQKFTFYKQRLFSKALFIDSGVGSIGIRPFELMSITEFGSEFIDFIKRHNK